MFIRKSTTLFVFMFVGLFVAMGAPALAKRQVIQVQPAPSSQSYQGQRFIHDAGGQDYYVDSKGALHLVTRRVIEAPGAMGGLYYIEDDDRAYSIDQSQRLYYRDSSGGIHFLEEIRPGRAMDSVIISRQTEGYAPAAPAWSRESCESQWQSCMSGCNGISSRQKYDRPNCVSNCDVIRRGCLGR
ncbi:hypothetical protein [Fundidesulfovibrio putealis]|uniref:hypothetical protein n=1 Tax=Fundidesulfovibrio putealis TaxID=270496 RepID=UPI000484C7DA|nr:hypothetical protein [Fundidesulfovibrio putealis]